MSIELRSSPHRRLVVLLFLLAFVGTVIFSVAYKRRAEESPVTEPTPGKGPALHSGSGRIALPVEAPTAPPKVNVAKQKAGPPDPEAERSAAAAADSAARAAAALANR